MCSRTGVKRSAPNLQSRSNSLSHSDWHSTSRVPRRNQGRSLYGRRFPSLESVHVFEILVMLFQVCGIMGLCLNRLMPRSTRWSSRGQVGSIVALFGLGIAGALCGRHDSEFALFAGGTMTVLLIGMTMGSGSIEKTEPARPCVTTEPELAA